ncbi:MAG: cytochrome-c oxidase, cbb3-type subunit II [Rhodothermales bacterium]|nr:cytochrome-c oxidase, cbb3-type subunit II [Rhodothermales bacterium]MBO6781328.1 cytochrome-c oxidase, cbb3-type subunit II [Rhodothermales bacterium]
MHRKLEGWPLVFTILVTISILVGGAAEFIPMVLIEDNVPEISTVEPFTPLELAGRDIYIREGCVGCHSQMVRPFRQELERYGPYGRPGETIYERPFLWGSKRTGPDLSRVGGKYPDLWHVRHFEDPRSTSPNSIMPKYDWLLRKDARLDDLPTKLARLRVLGTPYSDSQVDGATELARQQAFDIARRIEWAGGPPQLGDKEVVALIAYLQRLGQDIRAAGIGTQAALPSENTLAGTEVN